VLLKFNEQHIKEPTRCRGGHAEPRGVIERAGEGELHSFKITITQLDKTANPFGVDQPEHAVAARPESDALTYWITPTNGVEHVARHENDKIVGCVGLS
jgi:hypothetical protein